MEKIRIYLKTVATFLILFSSNFAFSQCTIVSSDFTCVDDLIGFSANSTNGVTSVSWQFGDGNTSTTAAPKHRYASAGTFTVTATIVQNNGATCTVNKTVEVFNPPNVQFEIDASTKYCFTENEICIIDKSTSGNSSTKNVKRIILWGDGDKSETNSPKLNDKICHTYQNPGKYSISVEVSNDKGCEAIKTTSTDIEILHDFLGTFMTGRQSKDCDVQKNWFSLDTSWLKYKSEISLAVIDYGDGTKDTLKSINDSTFFHDYKANGNYSADLHLTFKNGCQTVFKKPIGINLDKVTIDHSISDTVICYPEVVEFSHKNIAGALFSWTALDTAMEIIQNFGGSRVAYYRPPNPGKFFIEIRVKKGDCISFLRDSIEVVGIKAQAELLNSSQCEAKDTVLFCDRSIIHRSNDISYLWKFLDDRAEPCTTNTDKGINTNKNCNFSVDQNAKHFYDTTMCNETWLYVQDNENGCRDSVRNYIVIKTPIKDDFIAEPKVPCELASVDFITDECYTNLQINYDSLCGKDKFEEFRTPRIYSKTCDTSGWVTFGIVAITGDEKIYRSCDPNDFYIDKDRVCNDTFWFHKDFRLNEAPRPQAGLSFTGCLPATLKGQFYTPNQTSVTQITFDWGDGTTDSIVGVKDSLKLPSFTKTYTKSGEYSGAITMFTDSGCMASTYFDRKIGFYNDFDFLKPVCPGSTVQFVDSVVYWDDTNQYWRWEPPLPDRSEKIYWDFDDGNGFTGHQFLPTHVFKDPGTYTVRMAPKDETGCSDTTTKIVVVENIRAGIKDIGKKLLCDDILQLFDSSSVVDTVFDEIVKYYWDFGDGKAPSYLVNPFHYYSSYGSFTITHVAENKVGCTDTATISINIDGPLPRFNILSDTVSCVPHTVEFENLSQKATDYIWYFGDTSSTNNTLSTQSDSNVSFTYTKPGTYYVYLYAGDSVTNPDNGGSVYYCNSTFPDTTAVIREVRRIVILPIPLVDFSYTGSLCQGKTLTLVDESDTIYSTYKWYWDSDSLVSNNNIENLVLTDTGKFRIVYKPTYTPEGPYQRKCYDSTFKDIEVFSNKAEFTFIQDSICPNFQFNATTTEGDKLRWDFGHPASGSKNSSTIVNPFHSYTPDKGAFNVCLISESDKGCLDTACTEIQSDYQFEMMIPNVITPDGDGLNDELDIEMIGEDIFELSIFNRWGELVYHTKNDYEYNSGFNWNGKINNEGAECPSGTYFYVFRFREVCNSQADIEEYSGTVTVIRDNK